MLVLSRRVNEEIQVGPNIVLTVLKTGKTVKLGFRAPLDTIILRTELLGTTPSRPLRFPLQPLDELEHSIEIPCGV